MDISNLPVVISTLFSNNTYKMPILGKVRPIYEKLKQSDEYNKTKIN